MSATTDRIDTIITKYQGKTITVETGDLAMLMGIAGAYILMTPNVELREKAVGLLTDCMAKYGRVDAD